MRSEDMPDIAPVHLPFPLLLPPPLPKTSFLQRPDKTFPLHLLHGFPPLAAGVGDIGIHPAAHATAPLRPPVFSAESLSFHSWLQTGRQRKRKLRALCQTATALRGLFRRSEPRLHPLLGPALRVVPTRHAEPPALPATRSPLRGGRLRKARNDWGGGVAEPGARRRQHPLPRCRRGRPHLLLRRVGASGQPQGGVSETGAEAAADRRTDWLSPPLLVRSKGT